MSLACNSAVEFGAQGQASTAGRPPLWQTVVPCQELGEEREGGFLI